ncbi:MAG TPA: alpha/beta hydrolase [Polyangiaceae bacterium]|jgi:pimeloyl-ACP methyl ester carboxylesterase|nr:alpha/beta hydrolase [Polyangiaceae bacterium]
MPSFTRGEIRIQYEVHGAGYPVLLFAPGGMRSAMEFWQRTPFDPVAELAGQFRVIAMDQRNAGASRAPVSAADGWHTYAGDHLALLDELGVERCHLLGGCIGGAFALALIQAAPARVSAAVLQQPIGNSGSNQPAFHAIYDGWAEELVRARPDVSAAALAGLKANLYDGDFVFSATRADVARCPVPLLVLRGNDEYHPSAVSEEIASIAPRAELIPNWKTGEDLVRAVSRVRDFLRENTPR